jgi:hypothetical protein
MILRLHSIALWDRWSIIIFGRTLSAAIEYPHRIRIATHPFTSHDPVSLADALLDMCTDTRYAVKQQML